MNSSLNASNPASGQVTLTGSFPELTVTVKVGTKNVDTQYSTTSQKVSGGTDVKRVIKFTGVYHNGSGGTGRYVRINISAGDYSLWNYVSDDFTSRSYKYEINVQ